MYFIKCRKLIILLIITLSMIILLSCENKSNTNNDKAPTTTNEQYEKKTTSEEPKKNPNTEQPEKNPDSNKENHGNTEKQTENSSPKSTLIDAPLISQLPELKNGCEITSLAMMLNYAGIEVDKMTLAKKVEKDTTPPTYDKNGNIIEWGDPDEGFVGDITGDEPGYSVDPEPLLGLINQYLPNKAMDLTGVSYDEIEKTLSNKIPIVVWVTCDFKNPSKNTQWNSDGETVNATFSQHAVLLTGYDADNIYYNDPHSNTKNKKVSKANFIRIWQTMGKKALSYRK